ncbi:MAG: class I SAM-dependent methyltransferase [Planctomycetota bacterium]
MHTTRSSTEVFFRIAAESGLTLTKGMRILDLGCGAGGMVQELSDKGFEAWGCDFESENKNPGPRCLSIDPRPYHLPFEDGFFDLVVSNQVFEHVHNPEETCREILRVLKPEGAGIHVFPSRWRLIEPHVYVPLATWFRPRWWLSLWAALGIRNEFQKGMAYQEVASGNHRYLTECTRYLTKDQLGRIFSDVFDEVRFAEIDLFNTSSWLPRPIRSYISPLCAPLYSGMLQRIVWARKHPPSFGG